jgi:bacillolysin
MKRKTTLTFALFLSIHLGYAQSKIENSINKLKNSTQATISLNKNLNVPAFIKFPINKPYAIKGNSIEEKVSNFLNSNKSIYAIEDVNESLKYVKLKTDLYGLKHYILKQQYKGVDVFDTELKFHFDKNDNIKSINGNVIPDINLNTIPGLSTSDANNKALAIIKNQNLNQSGKTLQIISNKLWVFPKGLAQGHITSKHLTYEIEVRNDLDVREFLFIDAHSGKLIEQFTGIAHALKRTLYEGSTDANNLRYQEGGSTFFLDQWQKNEVETAGHVYHFFKNTFNVISYDNNDAEMVTVNNDPDINCPNANWNGVTTNYCTGTASDDVVAHEWGHAYTQYTSNLIYSYESGALNESFSDVWGETIDLINNYEDDGENNNVRSTSVNSVRWKMGEDADAFGVIRDMWDPTLYDNPGKMTDNDYYCDTGDNGGVHYNSGIPNHAYALIVDGGTYNGQTINGLGLTKAVHIFWRASSEYLTRTSGFSTFSDAIEASTNDLMGINLEGLSTTETPAGLSGEIITSADYNEVLKALIAVELRADNNCSFATILSENEDLCDASINNPIFTENWDDGINDNWSISQLPENASGWEAREWILKSNLPKGREGLAIYAPNPANGLESDGGGSCDTQHGIIRLESPTITMPNTTEGNFELAFTHNIASEAEYDGGNIKYSTDGGNTWALVPSSSFTVNPYNMAVTSENDNLNPMVGEDVFSGTDQNSEDSVWGQSVINLSSLGVIANSNIKFRWEFGSDGCNGKDGWYIDEIVVYNCASALSVNSYDYLNKNIRILKNPSSGIFNIKMENISEFKYDVYDITGKSLINKVNIENNSFQIDLSNYSKGLYFLKVYSNSGSVTKKLILN